MAAHGVARITSMLAIEKRQKQALWCCVFVYVRRRGEKPDILA